MEFRLLGPLEVAEGGQLLSLGGSRARALLGLLLLHRNEVVAVDRIVDELWGQQPPKTAGQAVRVYVSQLRKSLEPGRSDGSPQTLLTQGNGYVLKVDEGDVDLDRFDALRAEGRRLFAAGDVRHAAELLDEALSLWRGPPLQDFAYEQFAQSEIARLDELRLATLEDSFDAQLAAGRDSELVADLEQLVDANPLRERFRAQLMLALYRSGRQAEALETYQRGRRLMVDELGLEPSEILRRLETRILQHDPALAQPEATPRPPENGAASRSRRLTTLAVAVMLLGAALAAGLLIASTTGRTKRRPPVASLRIALVEGGRRDATNTNPTGIDPIKGLRAAAEQLGFQPIVLYSGSDQESAFLDKIASAARNQDLVIVGPTPYLEDLSKLTRRFPTTRFLVPDSVHDPRASFAGQRNVTGVNFDDYENGYLGGYLAALITHGHQAVSAVGGKRTDSVRKLIAGFRAGARHARPGIRVLVNYSRTFLLQRLCEAKANKQISRDSHVVFDVAGLCGFGALDAAQTRGVWGLGVDGDLSFLGPLILASVVKRLDNATEIAVTDFAYGELPRGRDLQFDLSNNQIGLVHINDAVPRPVRAKVEELTQKLRARDQARDTR